MTSGHSSAGPGDSAQAGEGDRVPGAVLAQAEPWRLGHRPALDGLRGIAIVLVLWAHVRPPALEFAGGSGVTLFFTLSGFLITSLLLEERTQKGRIDFRRFYERRARRLGPALVVVLLAVAVSAAALGPGVARGRDIAASLFFVANWVEANPGDDLNSLGVMWSLGVEEQFYLVWPLLVAMVWSKRWLLWGAVVLAVASVSWRTFLLADGATFDRVYTGTDTAAVALLVGVVLAVVRSRTGAGRSRALPVLAGGAVLLWVSAWSMAAFVLFGVPLIALAAGMMVFSATGAGRIRWLESPVLLWFGSRSYGLYLWHGTLLWVLRELYGWSFAQLAFVALPASLLLAECSYRWVEEPFRRRGRRAVAPGARGPVAREVMPAPGADV